MRVELQAVSKTFARVKAVDQVTVEFSSGRLTSVLGPSGCGKTTLLNLVGGIAPPTSGRIAFDGRDVTELPPEKRGLGYVFQNYALYPHLRVGDNIAFPLRFTSMDRRARAARVAELAELVRVGELLGRRPSELSGGQQQRVAIARSLAKSPGLLLMDEPLSNLDARLRTEMRAEIRRIQSATGITLILVTHDQEDAMAVSDSVVVMRDGRLEQVASPLDVYADPASLFVADFIGNPPANQLRVRPRLGVLELADASARLDLAAPAGLADGQEAVMAVRPESIQLTAVDGATDGAPDAPDSAQAARVVACSPAGRDLAYTVRLGGAELNVLASPDRPIPVGAAVRVAIAANRAYFFAPDGGGRLA
ncbi:MAG: ABC transporter ATP-binding protein [Bifidobacteriaceae bacterium]|jgi:multiple sugar transport system ATP-binding protein|nr:ABC transporter ATP-binding protein [Bifidobacteriaceae bacterium]